ncbi:hypothetical protein LguiB_003799 [Lonicera macranthoides]
MEERKTTRPQKPPALNCPRCNSSHTKFCYYNNYSLSQPRYFCKTCRRYWTEGGSLRNVPVGGGSRKNKRSSSSSSSSKKLPDHHHHHLIVSPPNFSQNPKLIHEGQDLNLAYPAAPTGNYNSALSQFVEDNKNYHPTTSSAMEFLKMNGIGSRGFTSLMSMPIPDSSNIYGSALGFQDFKPGLNFGFEGGYGNLQGVEESSNNNSGAGARLFFPYEELKQQVSSTTTTDQFEGNNDNRGNGDSANGYWNGGLGGGSW